MRASGHHESIDLGCVDPIRPRELRLTSARSDEPGPVENAAAGATRREWGSPSLVQCGASGLFDRSPSRPRYCRRSRDRVALREFMAQCEAYFDWGGCIIDQPFQPRLPEGMIRCYMGADRVAGFGQQRVTALIPPPPEGPDSPAVQPGPRIMHGPDAVPFRALRGQMEQQWVPQMMEVLGIDRARLPIIWDADFLYGPRTTSGEDTYVLCEINVSSCFAIPDQAPAVIARLAAERCSRHQTSYPAR
jgi:uncharacterized protein DUF6815